MSKNRTRLQTMFLHPLFPCRSLCFENRQNFVWDDMDVRCANVLKTETRTVLCEFYSKKKTKNICKSKKKQTFQYNLFIPPFAIVQPCNRMVKRKCYTFYSCFCQIRFLPIFQMTNLKFSTIRWQFFATTRLESCRFLHERTLPNSTRQVRRPPSTDMPFPMPQTYLLYGAMSFQRHLTTALL